jgi:Domain of unknown function (DUF4263)
MAKRNIEPTRETDKDRSRSTAGGRISGVGAQEVTAQKVWDGFVKLMDRDDLKEGAYQRYMVGYPALIPASVAPLDNTIYSQLKLGSQYVADFAFCRDDSIGFRWHFIEIEKPRDRLLNNKGNGTAEFLHARQQLLDWSIWFKNNQDYVRKHFPHPERAIDGLADPELMLVIGRREHMDNKHRLRIQAIGEPVTVRTFDSLRYWLESPRLSDKDQPLQCRSFNGRGETRLLSSMKIDIRYQMDWPNKPKGIRQR